VRGNLFPHQRPPFLRFPSTCSGTSPGFLQQFEGDRGTFPDAHDGFKGRSIAVGPLITYKAKFGETDIDFRLKWAHEVEVENHVRGDAIFVDIIGVFRLLIRRVGIPA